MEYGIPGAAHAALSFVERINDAWLEGRTDRLADLFHAGIVMVLPGFAGRVEGAEAVVAGFEDFCKTVPLREGESAVA